MENFKPNQPLVSIIVVSYNHSKYIKECLNSIQAQRYSAWELILADDCSNDNSVQVFEHWLVENKQEATRVFHKVNAGFCKTLNECIALSAGSYIKVLAADDFLHPNYVSESISALHSLGDEYGVVFANAEFVDGDSRQSGKYLIGDVKACPHGEIYRKLLAGNFIPALTAMMRRSVFEKIGPYDESIWIEDWDYWLRTAKYFKFAFVPAVLAYYRRHEHNVSSNRDMVLTEWQILLKQDETGRYHKELNAFAKSRFFIYNSKMLRSMYKQYPYHSKLLYYCLKFKLPWFAYDLLDKLRARLNS